MFSNIEKYYENVLMIGPDYLSPKGGIAMVLFNLNKYVFQGKMRHVANSCAGSRLKKLYVMIVALIKMFFLLCVDRKIKIIHIHTSSYNGLRRTKYFVDLSNFFRKKVLLHIHGGGFVDYYKANKRFVDNCLRKTSAIISLSESWKSIFKEQIGFEKDVFVVNNIVAEPIMRETEPDGLLHFLFLGLIASDKGVFDLLKSLSIIKTKIEDKILLHIGGLGKTERLVNDIERYGLNKIVKYEGWVSDDAKIELLNKCSVFILPSYYEGLPLSIVEAMSYGMEVISSNVGAIPMLVTDGENGKLLRPGDIDGLASAICEMTNNSPKYNEISIMRAQSFMPNEVSKQLNNIYSEIIRKVS